MPYKNKAKDRREKGKRSKRLWAVTPDWKRTEMLVAVMLRRKGVKCNRVGKVRSPFDIVTASGLRVEVKAASFRQSRKLWTVSIQRFGKMTEDAVDWYAISLNLSRVFRTKQAKYKRIYLIIKSPIRQRQIVVTLHRLLTRWSANVNAWHLIQQAERALEGK